MDANTLTFAKRLVSSNGRAHCGITADVYHAELEKLARENKRDGESLQQSYIRCAEQTEAGALLLKAALWAPQPKQAPQDFASPKPPSRGPAQDELDRLVDEFMRNYNRANTKKLTRSQSYDRVFNSEANRELRERVKAEEAEATGVVRRAREPIFTAEREFGRPDWRLGRSPGSARN